MVGLRRNLGLSAVLTISLGAMIGSGIFVLPGLAAELAGPAAALAYFLAGLVVVPAALSKSEMATALPKAGGAYLFIDRAMGPLMGTVAGFGVWFALVFKSAFALVGLGGYLVYFVDLPIVGVGIVLALALIGINVIGAKQSGRFQTIVVLIVLGSLTYFSVRGGFNVDVANYQPFMPRGFGGVLSATGLVFISYAGVTKVASVAEEVKDPEKTLPRGMLGSIALMLILYPAIVWVIVGNVPIDSLGYDPAPIATTASQFMGDFGVKLIAGTAVLALISMANAGLLSSSRYPLAMARERLAPRALSVVNARTGTPILSIVITGAVIVGLIAFVPLLELAKLASAFQVIVFSLINLSLIAFREADPAWYKPTFRSPFYPWVQIFGIFASLFLLTQLGWISIVGSSLIIVVGVLWYRYFGRSRASRESAALDALRLRSIGPLVNMTSEALASPGRDHVLIPVSDAIGVRRLTDLLRMAHAMAAEDGRITLARIDRQRAGALWWRRDTLPRADDPFRVGANKIADELGLDLAVVRPRGDDAHTATVDYAERHAVDLILGELPAHGDRSRYSTDLLFIRDHASSDVAYLGNQELRALDNITVLGAGSPFDVTKIDTACRLAQSEDSVIRFLHVLGSDATDTEKQVIDGYHHQIAELIEASTVSEVDRSDDLVRAIRSRAGSSDLVIMGASRRGIGTELSDRISEVLAAPVLVVHAPDRGQRSRRQRLLERLIY